MIDKYLEMCNFLKGLEIMFLYQPILLQVQIKKCRDKLYSTAKSKGNVNDPEVIEVSQELDNLIISLQKIMMSKRIC
jgi:hypothetical protein